MPPVQELFTPAAIAANGTRAFTQGQGIGGFLCTVGGVLNLGLGSDGSGTKLVNTLNVTAGIYYPLPTSVGADMAIVLSGNAAGTVFYV